MLRVRVDFFKGVVQADTGEEAVVYWARATSGDIAVFDGAKQTCRLEDQGIIVGEEHVTAIDLPGLEQDLVDAVVKRVLIGGYLKKPGIKDKGEAVLFVMVNEALQQLEEIARSEELL